MMQRRLRTWARHLDAQVWFPHVPLALAVGVLGGLRFAPIVGSVLGGSPLARELGKADAQLVGATLRGLPQGVAGVFLLAMSAGLLLRSRLAWVAAILVTGASFALTALTPEIAHRPLVTLYNALLLAALLLARRHFRRSSLAAATLFALSSSMIVLGYGVLGSYALGAAFQPRILDVPTALYFTVVTMGTVGYGDITPQTTEARIFVISMIISGVTVFATSLSAILAPVLSRRVQSLIQEGAVPMERSNHYVIVGDSALARNSFKELRGRDQRVTLIVPHLPQEPTYRDADVIVGDGSDLDVLRRADADKAAAVLALSADDSENAFVVLAAKELAGNPRTVAVVNDAKNMARVNRVQPDLVIAPQVLGAELLAMALSGEPIKGDELMNRFLHASKS